MITVLHYNAAVRYIEVEGRGTQPVWVQVIHRDTCHRAMGASKLSPSMVAKVIAHGLDYMLTTPYQAPQLSTWRVGKCCAPLTLREIFDAEIECVHCRRTGKPLDCSACGQVCSFCLDSQMGNPHSPREYRYVNHGAGMHDEFMDCTANL